jgi:hypothetical protein
MPSIIFDTYAYIKKLQAVGFTEEQTAVQAETFAGLIDEQLATKRDLKELELSLRREIKEMETSLRHEMKELESRLIIRLAAMIAASIAVVATLVKLL